MGWSIGHDGGRDIGYGVPAVCDHPRCNKRIDRGLSYVCGSNPAGQPHGCGLYFCSSHLSWCDREEFKDQYCPRCRSYNDKSDEYKDKNPFFDPYKEKPDVREWNIHKLIDESWAKWREDEPDEVAELVKRIQTKSAKTVLNDLLYRALESESLGAYIAEVRALQQHLGFPESAVTSD